MRGSGGVRFGWSSQALSRRVGSNVLVTTPGDELAHELSGGASAVWADLCVPRTLTELVERLASAHGVAPVEITDDVAGCLEELLRVGVVAEVSEVQDDG